MTKNYLYLDGTKQTEELRKKLENKTTVPHTTLNDEYWISEILERIAIPQSGINNKIFILEK